MIIFVPGDPVGKERPRHDPRHPERRPHTPQKTKNYEETVAWHWKNARGPKLDGPIRLRIVWHCRIPKSASKAKRAAMNSGQILPMTRPDLDNVCKSVMDALNGVAYHDDSQIVSLTAIRRYAEITGIFVEVEQEYEDRSEGANAPKTGRVDTGRN